MNVHDFKQKACLEKKGSCSKNSDPADKGRGPSELIREEVKIHQSPKGGGGGGARGEDPRERLECGQSLWGERGKTSNRTSAGGKKV